MSILPEREPYVHPITRLRTERNWSIRELGRRAGVHQDTVRLAEQGVNRDGPKALHKIAAALGTTVDAIHAEVQGQAMEFVRELRDAISDWHARPEDFDPNFIADAMNETFKALVRTHGDMHKALDHISAEADGKVRITVTD